MRRLVAVDVETTGLDPVKHELIEVGLVFRTGQDPSDADAPTREESFSLAFDVEAADPKALEVNGYGKRNFARLVNPVYAAGFLRSILDDAHLVGKNPQFDGAFLAAFIAKAGPHTKTPPWHHRMVDVGTLAWGWYNGVELGGRNEDPLTEDFWDTPPNVEQTAKLLGVPLPEGDAHTALGDARWAFKAMEKVVFGR